MQQQIIPLFPLSIVVFPGHLVPLHIFEERYKKMIADCAGEEGRYEPFGISYENDGDVAAIVLAGRGRPDPCVLPRAVPIVEAMLALVLADHLLRQRGQVGEGH